MSHKRNKKKSLLEIRRLYEELRKDTQSEWKRDLPFEELLFDRWERARNLGFGKGASIYHNSYVYGDVQVGKETWVGPLTILDGSGGLKIGSYCNISAGVQIYSHDTVKSVVSGTAQPPEKKAVKIGNHCFVGPQSVIKKGVSIGDHAIIGACSFVNQNIPSFSIAFGAPAKIVGKVRVLKNGKVSFKYF